MNIHKYSIIFAFAFFALMPVKAKVEIVNNAVAGAFPIASANEATKVFVSPSEHVLVEKVAYHLSCLGSPHDYLWLNTTPYGCKPQVFDNKFKEYGLSWKNQVLRNGAVVRMRFAIDKSKSSHVISLICGDAGMMVQKVIVDWGGLKKSYIGPSMDIKNRNSKYTN